MHRIPSWLRSLKELLSEAPTQSSYPTIRRRRHPSERNGQQKGSRENGTDAIKRLAATRSAASSPVLASSVELVGLADVKDRFGDKWPQLAKKAMHIAEQEIERQLLPGDIFRREGDDNFLICFSTSDHAYARLVAQRIDRSVKSRLVSELAELESVHAHSVIAEVDGTELVHAAEPFEVLRHSLRKVAQEEAAHAQGHRSKPAYALLRQIPVIYQPMWSSNDIDPTVNYCLLDWAYDRPGQKIEAISSPAMTEAMDCVLFTRSVEQLHQSTKAGKILQMLIPVHFSTLDEPETLEDFLQLGALLPSSYRRRITLEVHDVPETAGSRALASVLRVAEQVTAQVVLRTTRFDLVAAPAVHERLHGLSLSVAKAQPTILSAFTAAVRVLEQKQGRRYVTYVTGANSLLKAKAAITRKVTYISGPAIHANQLQPCPINQKLAVDRGLMERRHIA